MKNLLLIAAIAMAVCSFGQTAQGPVANAGQTGIGPVMRPGGPDAATRAKLRAGMHARMGGTVMRPNLEPGICFVNAQKTVASSALEVAMTNIRNEFRISCYMREGKFTTLAELAKMADTSNHACVVCVIDDPAYPQMLVAPDNAWALVNAAPLKTDGAGAEKIAERMAKLAYRGFGMAMGAGFSAHAGGLMQPGSTLKELDAIYGKASPPDCHFPIQNYCELRKVARGGVAPYRIACIEGWAPPPVNEVQRKIAEEIKSQKKK